MSELLAYLRLGFGHILDLNGYDHILFLVALIAGEDGRWRRLVVLVSAFTLGHTVTLALATLGLVRVDPALVEFLIPLTIMVTSVLNLLEMRLTERGGRPTEVVKNSLALVFGLIHGLGFSNFLRAALGAEESLLLPLLGFNLGVECGQLAVVALLGVVARGMARSGRRASEWGIALSLLTGGVALALLVQRIP